MLDSVCRQLSRPPSVPLHLSPCSLFDGAAEDKSCRVEPLLHFSSNTGIQREKESEGDKGSKRDERKGCHIDLVLLPATVGGGTGRRVTQRKQAVRVRRENIELPLSWHSLTRKRQHQLCVYIHV